MSGPSRVVRLEKGHDRTGFSSGAPELDTWLTKHAWENQRADNATTYVVLDGDAVVAYYAITVAGAAGEDVPPSVASRAPSQLGALLLARFAIAEDHQGRGLGRALLADVLQRSLELSQAVGIKMLLIHCRDDAACDFYLRQAEFLESPTDPLHLLMPMKDVAALVRGR